MFHLARGLYQNWTQKEEAFVLILGLDNAGKTTYLEQTKTKLNPLARGLDPSKVTTTVGLNVGKIDYGGMQLTFWDLGGHEELQALWDRYYAETDALIWMVDSTDADRLQQSYNLFRSVIRSPLLRSVPTLIIANKRDLLNCLALDELKDKFLGIEEVLGPKRPFRLLPASALAGEGVDDGIRWIVEQLNANRKAAA